MSGYPFAELCAKSCFSLLEGASQPSELIERAKNLGLFSIAVADRNGLYGSVRAHMAAKELEQPYIVGAEIEAEGEGSSLILLVQNHEGYTNLSHLLTMAHQGRRREEAALPEDALAAHSRGLIAILPSYDESLATVVKEAFPGRGFYATFRHRIFTDALREAQAREIEQRFDLPLIATARPLFHDPKRKQLADILQCIREGSTLDAARARLMPNAEAYLRSGSEMARIFRDAPERLYRTVEIAESCTFSLSELRYDFPRSGRSFESPECALRRLVEENKGLRYPQGVPPSVEKQLEKELDIITELRVAQFFLSVYEIIEIARERRILCQGRGSAANSAVCFVLGITAVDPSRSNLLFERFLSKERNEPPDIDVDFEHERREEIIQAIYEKYGRDRAAMVSEVICFRGKSALREAGKALGLSRDEVSELAKTIGPYEHPEEGLARLRDSSLSPNDRRIRLALRMASELQGLPRHLATHVGGFVLSDRPLAEIAPVEPANMKDRTVLPWDKDDIDALGFFKVDILGLGMLTAIRKTLALIHEKNETPEPFDPIEALASIPAEDSIVYDAIGRADTMGVFQIESRAQMAMLPRLRPRCFYDLVIQVAIVRPGPIQGGMVHPYLRRRNGEEPATMPHESLRPILERTLGVPIFQEQVMQIAMVAAGYTGGEADELRRDMAAWRKSSKLLRHRDKLLRGFAKKGIAQRFGEMLFEQIKGFGEYGFPESHSASFALLVYASAWLKVHHPAAFACSLINSQPMGFYSPQSIIRDARNHGVTVLPIDISFSHWDSTLEDGSLRLGLRLIKGFARAAAVRIEDAREKAPFRDFNDLAYRAELRQDMLDSLARAGALSSITSERRQAMWQVRAPRFGRLFAHQETKEPRPSLAPMQALQELALDYESTGLSISDHPLRHLRRQLDARGVVPAESLPGLAHGQKLTIAGVVIARQRPSTANGVIFMTLEDETAVANLIVIPKVERRFESIVRHASLVLVRGKLERSPREPIPEPGRVPVIHILVEEIEEIRFGGIQVKSRDWG